MLFESLRTMLEKSADSIGIIGVILLLTAFYLLNSHKVTAKDLRYQVMNLVAATLILYSLLFHWNMPSVLIEIAWISISLYGVVKTLKGRRVATDDNKVIPMTRKVKKNTSTSSCNQ